ncbi:MAG TPA: alcohol dehydrogenase catalytic domain-containing protein [Solirubrobacteraceae bacterium]|nr:alcohol dehydrogenase catalytic domain-containing protein [Solirubrobacteraceae bacterium]
MRAAVLVGPGSVVVRDVLRPSAARDGDVVAEVHYTGICRTDAQLTEAGQPHARVLGHEVVCRIPEEDGFLALNNEISCGRCSYCAVGLTSHCEELSELGVNADGGYAEWILTPRDQLHPFAFANAMLGVLIEPLSCALRAEQRLWRLIGPAGRPSILVVGGGVSGALIAYLVSRWPQHPEVAVFDPVDAPLPWLRRLPARRCEAPTSASADIVVECSGTPGGCISAFAAARKAAVVCLYGVPRAGVAFPRTARELFADELTVLTSQAGASSTSMRAAIDLIGADEAFFGSLLGRVVPLARLPPELVSWGPAPGTRTVVDVRR